MISFPTTRRPRQRLLIFARYPELGRVKSRLARDLGAEPALALYSAMVRDLLAGIGGSDQQTEVEVGWTAATQVSGEQLQALFGQISLFTQAGKSLGDRLVVAFSERIFFHHADKVIAIGTDDPALPRRLIDCAFQLLDSCEYVLGPAEDGGYYLVGARGPTFRTALFEGISWGESTVLEETRARIRALNATLAILPPRRDIDDSSALQAFLHHPELTPQVAAEARRLELLP